MIKSKGGSAHLEMITSFIIFVGFTLFLMYTINPGNAQNNLADAVLLGLENNFFNNVTSNVSIVLVRNVSMGDSLCRPWEITENSLYFQDLDNSSFFYIYSSPDFEDDTSLLNCTEQDSYMLGFVDVREVISNQSLYVLQTRYESDYDGLKQYLKVPPTADFSARIMDTDEYSLSKRIPDETPVTAGNYRHSVLYQNGTIIDHDFEIKIW